MFKYPSFIQLNITNQCNLFCKHCYNDSGKNDKDNLQEKEIYRLLDYFLSKKIVCITFGGGEPLLHKKIYDFISYASNRGGRITLLTNGILINNKAVVEKLCKAGVSRVRVSLDGSNEKINDFIRSKGSFKGAVKALRLLSLSKIENIAVMTSVNKYNINDLENIIKLLIKLGIKEIKFIPTISGGRAVRNFNEYILDDNYVKRLLELKDKLKNKYKNKIYVSVDSPLEAIGKKNKKELLKCGPCLIGQVFLGIKSNGDIFACPMLDNVIIGNIKKDKIHEVWAKSQILNEVRDLKLLKGKCKKCKILKYCGGGCRAISYLRYKDIRKPDPYCWI